MRSSSNVSHLWAEALDLRGGVAHHLDALVVVRHRARQVGDLDQLGRVVVEDVRGLLSLGLPALLKSEKKVGNEWVSIRKSKLRNVRNRLRT